MESFIPPFFSEKSESEFIHLQWTEYEETIAINLLSEYKNLYNLDKENKTYLLYSVETSDFDGIFVFFWGAGPDKSRLCFL